MAPKTQDTDKPKLPFGSNDLAAELFKLEQRINYLRRKREANSTTGLVAINSAMLAAYEACLKDMVARTSALGYEAAIDWHLPRAERLVEQQLQANRERYHASRPARQAAAGPKKAIGGARAKKVAA